MNGTSITVEISNWPTPARIELMELIGRVEARLQGRQPASAATAPAVPEEVEPSGWNKEAYMDVLTKLLSRHHVQVAVIFEAIKTGTGYVSRERVYELGNYPETRSLKGFTRPVNRLTAEAVEAGLLPEDADDLLTPDYDPNVTSFQRAKGFIVPMEVVKMANEWRQESQSERQAI
jgi:hypothetical protein